MLALPYITEETNFSGAIYLTEPTLHFGRLFMEETIEFLEQRSSKSTQDLGSMPTWKSTSNLPGNLAHISGICKTWKKTYSREQIESCLSKVTLVGFSEQKDIFGLVTVSPVSAGFCIGSSNWIINSGFEKIAYVSGSSTLTTHPSSLDQSPLKNADCLILTALTQTPTHNPDPMMVEFCKTVIETSKSGGNVLVPCYPSGIDHFWSFWQFWSFWTILIILNFFGHLTILNFFDHFVHFDQFWTFFGHFDNFDHSDHLWSFWPIWPIWSFLVILIIFDWKVQNSNSEIEIILARANRLKFSILFIHFFLV